jgi:hypothetical protein
VRAPAASTLVVRSPCCCSSLAATRSGALFRRGRHFDRRVTSVAGLAAAKMIPLQNGTVILTGQRKFYALRQHASSFLRIHRRLGC